ncbi:hypothetical protein CRG98_015111 [Punica granatum]|uniref:Uncharacterized protein n=1 Tax=Punica granatum TaxID=22663 RepID=A0A2I0K7M8_PUNGR|nr:hypothetical protein CRG98_015111 [Punica granatum]
MYGSTETSPAPLSPTHHSTVHVLPLFITASTSRAKVEVHRARCPIEGLLLSFEVEKASIATVIRCSGKIQQDRISAHKAAAVTTMGKGFKGLIFNLETTGQNLRPRGSGGNDDGELDRIAAHEEAAATTAETSPAPLSPPHHHTVHFLPLFITASTSRANVDGHRSRRPIEGLLLSFKAEKASIATVIRCSGKIERDRISAQKEEAVTMTGKGFQETCPVLLSPPHHRTFMFFLPSSPQAPPEQRSYLQSGDNGTKSPPTRKQRQPRPVRASQSHNVFIFPYLLLITALFIFFLSLSPQSPPEQKERSMEPVVQSEACCSQSRQRSLRLLM